MVKNVSDEVLEVGLGADGQCGGFSDRYGEDVVILVAVLVLLKYGDRVASDDVARAEMLFGDDVAVQVVTIGARCAEDEAICERVGPRTVSVPSNSRVLSTWRCFVSEPTLF